MAKEDNTTRVRAYRPSAAPATDRPYVEVLRGSGRGRVVALSVGNTLIGRASGLALRFDDDGVSRHHAKIAVSGDGMAQMIDLESTNGTFVNGVRIARMALREGDRIEIGPGVAMRFGHLSEEELSGRIAASAPLAAADSVSLPLSEREVEIACLVADGLSNLDIADRLHISARTVGSHLTNIYKRLEIHTRAELTRFAVEHKLSSVLGRAYAPPRRGG
jgi:DNA-binding CsgD family transcriptional regulator